MRYIVACAARVLEKSYAISTLALLFRFTEMPTNNFVESSFWNFDSLFQPQQHPARDAHDTFFMAGQCKHLGNVAHM